MLCAAHLGIKTGFMFLCPCFSQNHYFCRQDESYTKNNIIHSSCSKLSSRRRCGDISGFRAFFAGSLYLLGRRTAGIERVGKEMEIMEDIAVDLYRQIGGAVESKRHDIATHRRRYFTGKSGQTVYIDGGARVYGMLVADSVRDVRFYGRGEVHPRGRGEGIYIKRSRNVDVNGLIVTQIPVGGCDSVNITNVKSISYYGWPK